MLILVEIFFFLYVETVVLLNVFVETLMHLFWIFLMNEVFKGTVVI